MDRAYEPFLGRVNPAIVRSGQGRENMRTRMNLFITGASGFIGSNIVQTLGGQHRLYAMARSESAAQRVKALGATPVLCELGSVTPENLSDCEMVIHAAAFTKEWGTREEFWETTVHGTKQLLEVAKRSGVRRFIQISTEAVLFTGQDLNDIDETYPYPEKSRFLYSESKLEAEKLVLAAHDPQRFEVSVIRPRLVWGPGDRAVLPVLINMVRQRKFMWVNGGANLTSTTHIRNLVEGVRCLINNWRAKQVYFITDAEVHTYREFLSQYIATQGVTVPDKSISKPLIRLSANIVELVWRLLRIPLAPPITRLAAYMLSSNFTISHQKATRELGYHPIVSFDEAMNELRQGR